MKKMKRLLGMLLVAVMCIAMLGGCKSSSSSGSESESGTEEAKGSMEGLKVGVIFANLTNDQYVEMADEIETALKENGCEVNLTDAGDDSAQALAAAEGYASSGCEAIVLAPFEEEAMESIASSVKAINPDIKVFGISIVAESADYTIEVSDYDASYAAGEYAGEWINENKGGSATVGTIYATIGTLKTRRDGFMDGVKAVATGEIKEVEALYEMGGTRTGYDIMEDWLQANPDLQVIWGSSDSFTIAAYEALKAHNVNQDEYGVFSIDATQNALNEIKENGAFRASIDTGATASTSALIEVMKAVIEEGADPADIKVTIPCCNVTQENVEGYTYDISQVTVEY